MNGAYTCLICNKPITQDDLYLHVRLREEEGMDAILVAHARHFLNGPEEIQ